MIIPDEYLKLHKLVTAGQTTTGYSDLQNIPFWITDQKEHEKKYDTEKYCCFNHAVGLPDKEHLDVRKVSNKNLLSKPHPSNFLENFPEANPDHFFTTTNEIETMVNADSSKDRYDEEITYVRKHPMYDYEMEIFDALFLHRKIAILKATGLGVTELILRIMAWLPLHDPELYNNTQFVITTGPNIELAKKEISRMYNLFLNLPYKPSVTDTTITINGCLIESFPSHHLDAARGLEKCRFFFADEYDYFPPSQQEVVRTVAERYEAKSHPFIVLNSTPGLPGGLLDRLYREVNPPYFRLKLLYERGINKIYTPYEISVAKQHPNFQREYNGQFGVGMGNIWPYELVDAIMEDYPLGLTQWGDKVMAVDPGFGNSENASQYAIVGAERINNVTYIKHAVQFERASTSAMLDKTVDMFRLGYNRCLFDSSQPGLIRDLINGNSNRPPIPVLPVNFREHLGTMTVEAVEAVAQKRVKLHSKAHQDLAYQLKAATYNDRGHPDKKKMAFDLGDGFIMVLYGMKNANSYVIRPVRSLV